MSFSIKNINKNLEDIFDNETLSDKSYHYYVSILIYYFNNNRPQKFRKLLPNFWKLFPKTLSFGSIHQGIDLANLAFTFSYTLCTNDYLTIQNDIRRNIADPYFDWVQKKSKEVGFKKIIFSNFNNRVLIIVRHANTRGMYAPGSLTYTYAKALLKHNYCVDIITIGYTDENFKDFANSNENISLYQIDHFNNKNKNYFETYKKFKNFIEEFKPVYILTEIEFDVTSLISIVGCSCPIIYMSAGFYDLPWYDLIGIPLTTDISKNFERKNSSFIYPVYFEMDLMNPKVDQNLIIEAKNKLGFSEKDIIISSFARMEKFSKKYCELCVELLNNNQNIIFLFSGPNDPSLLLNELDKYIKLNRVFVLPESDVHILGNLSHIGLETFPLTSGASVVELMAKGKPVLTMRNPNQDENLKYRINDLVCSNKKDVIEKINLLISDKKFYQECSKKSKELVIAHQRPNDLIDSIEKALSEN